MLRCTRPLLAEAATAAASASTAAPAAASAAVRGARGPRGPRNAPARPPLGERYDAAGYPSHSLNIKYSSLIVGQHFERVVFDRRTQLMALLSACNLIREVLTQEGRILIHCKDPALQGDLLAAARDCGEFTHFGKWPPGGFTNRPQVAAVPQLPALVIMMEHDNHVLMREAFQMCIPRVAPVDIYNNKADSTPEVPLHAAQMSVSEKRRMLTFLSSFIAKLKFGQMPVGDTQSRFKEFVAREWESYQRNERDVPEPYVKAISRPYDERPEVKYGLDPKHVAFNQKRSFEESSNYHIAALQPQSYRDAAETEDDVMADKPPPIDEWDMADHVEFNEMSDKFVRQVEDDAGTYVHKIDPVTGALTRVDDEIGVARDYETEEFEAQALAATLAGARISDPSAVSQQDALTETLNLDKAMKRGTDVEAREMYEEWIKDRQDAANDTIPYVREHEVPLQSHWTTPGEDLVQKRLWTLKNRVRELREQGAEDAGEGETESETAPAAGAAQGKKSKRRLIRPRRVDSSLTGTPLDPEIGNEVYNEVVPGMSAKQLWASRKTGANQRAFEKEVGDLWDDDVDGTVEGFNNLPIVPLNRHQAKKTTKDAGAPFTEKGGQKRGYATSTFRRGPNTPPTSSSSSAVSPSGAAKSASSSSSSSSSSQSFTSKLKLPRWIFPFFLLAPLAAYWASEQHASESELKEAREQRAEVVRSVKSKLGLESPVVAALTAELGAKQSSYALLLQTREMLLESVAPAERKNHKVILDEVEATKNELEQEIAELQRKIKAAA